MAVSSAMSGLIPLLVRRRFSIRCSLPEKLEPIEPTVVQDGPCKQNILGGEDVHIESLHSLFIHKDDGDTACMWSSLPMASGKIDPSPERWLKTTCTTSVLSLTSIHLADSPALEERREELSLGFMFWCSTGLLLWLLPCQFLTRYPRPDISAPSVGRRFQSSSARPTIFSFPLLPKLSLKGPFPLPKQPQKFHWEENARLHLPCDTHNWPVYKANCITHRDDAILPMSACRRLTDETVSSLMIPYVNGLIG